MAEEKSEGPREFVIQMISKIDRLTSFPLDAYQRDSREELNPLLTCDLVKRCARL